MNLLRLARVSFLLEPSLKTSLSLGVLSKRSGATKRILLASFSALLCFGLLGCSNERPVSAPADYGQSDDSQYIFHRIKYPGETLAVIAAWYTKSAKNWPELIENNPKIVPSKLKVGDIIKIPKRLVRRFSSLPQSFVTSFKNGINQDTSVGNDVESAPPTSKEGSEPKSDEKAETVGKKSDSFDSTVYEPDAVEEKPSKTFPTEAPVVEATTAPAQKPIEAPAAKDDKPANTENDKIRDQLMQELLQ